MLGECLKIKPRQAHDTKWRSRVGSTGGQRQSPTNVGQIRNGGVDRFDDEIESAVIKGHAGGGFDRNEPLA